MMKTEFPPQPIANRFLAGVQTSLTVFNLSLYDQPQFIESVSIDTHLYAT